MLRWTRVPVLNVPSAWDLAPAVLIALLAFTNGHQGSTCMMYGPGLVPLGRRAEEGSKLSLAIIAGLAAGSVLSFGVSAALQGT